MKVDLFEALRAISGGDYRFFDKLDDVDIKTLSPYLLLLWMRAPSSDASIRTELTNEFVNPYVFNLSGHPRLLFKLFVAAQGGYGNCRYRFEKSKRDKRVAIVAEYRNISDEKARDIVARCTPDMIDDMARSIGKTEKEVKDLHA